MNNKRFTALSLAFVFAVSGCGKNAEMAKDTEVGPESYAEYEESDITDSEFLEDAEEEDSAEEDGQAEDDAAAAGSNDPAQKENETEGEEISPVLGDEQFDAYLPLLYGKRVAILTNQTGIIGDEASFTVTDPYSEPDSLIRFGTDKDGKEITYGEHILDALIEKGVEVTAVFSPEHGFRGVADAGETVGDSVDEKTGVPIVSLYGNGSTNEPEEADMELFDTVVVDMQDVGIRFFTYYISLLNMMNACAAYGKDMILLDRPNPNGFYVDGPILKEEFKSGVGMLPVPIVHGLTWGELAQMINGEGWLREGRQCSLKVIPCLNYTHETRYPLVMEPSPNLKDMHAIYLYPSTCYFENTVVSVGRGTEFPFNAYGSPYFKEMDEYGFSFTPESMEGAKEPPFEGETCYGKDLRTKPVRDIFEEQINLVYLVDAYNTYQELEAGDPFFGKGSNDRYFVDLLFGTDSVRKMIEDGASAEEIKASWQPELESFMEQRRPYLLYPE